MVLLLMLESLWLRRPSTTCRWAAGSTVWLLADTNFAAVLWLVHLAASSPWARSLAVKPGLLESPPPALAFLRTSSSWSSAATGCIAYFTPVHFFGASMPSIIWTLRSTSPPLIAITRSKRSPVPSSFCQSSCCLACRPRLPSSGTRARNHCARQSQQSCASRAGRPHAALVAGDSRFPSPASPQRPANTNSNDGTVLPWFDYLFKTASDVPYQQQREIQPGVKYLRGPRDGRLDRLLSCP